MNYAALADKAAALIEANGKAATLTRISSAGGYEKKFNASTGEWYWEDDEGETTSTDPTTYTEVDCYVVEDRYQIQHIDGTLIQADDRLFLCTETPEMGDTITVGGAELTVIRAVPMRPSDTTLYCEVQAR